MGGKVMVKFLKTQRSNWMTYYLKGVISTLLLHVNLIEGTRVTPKRPFLPHRLDTLTCEGRLSNAQSRTL